MTYLYLKRAIRFVLVVIIIISAPESASDLYAQKEHDLGVKEVIGEDKRKFDNDAKIIKKTNTKDLKEKDVNVRLMEEDLHLPDEPKVEIADIPDMKENLLSNQKDEKGLENKMLFGLGGFKRIDSFRYLVDYTKDDEEKQLAYYLHIDRLVRGKDRANSDIDSDDYIGKIWYKSFFLNLSHGIKDEDLPGRQDVLFLVNSSKEKKISELDCYLDLMSTKKHNLKVGVGLYRDDVSSLPVKEREYNNNLYNSYLSYDNFFNIGSFKSLLQFNLGFYRDNNFKGNKTGSYNFNVLSKIKQQALEPLEINVRLGTEYIQQNNKNKGFNYVGALRINKYLSSHFSFGFGLEKENLNKRVKDIYDAFSYDDDFLPIEDIKKDDNFNGDVFINFSIGAVFFESKLKHFLSKNKLVYMEDYSIPGEVLVDIINYHKKIGWQEFEFKAGTAFYVLRGEVVYVYSTLDNLPFSPVHDVKFNLILQYKSYKNRIEGGYNSKMYGDPALLNRLPEYKNINLYNDFKFSRNLTISVNAFNLINFTGEKKTEYSIDQRKFMLEFKINY